MHASGAQVSEKTSGLDGKYIRAGAVAKVIGVSQGAASKWLMRNGAGVLRGRLVVTTRELLKKSFPEVWEEIMLARASSEDCDD